MLATRAIDVHADDLLTTGQAAAILGTTARHVVHLCERGELPYSMTGSHRRIRRADVDSLAGRAGLSQGGPMTEDQLRSLWLGRLAAARVALDPAGSLQLGRASAQRFLARQPAGEPWLRQWLTLIDRGPEAVMRMLTSTSSMARELRQNSPFGGLVPEAERKRVIAAFREQNPRPGSR